MHGQNVVRKQELREDGTLQVQDVWFTVQGEGPFTGRSAVFIRLTGCNLRCWFCDTSWDDAKDPYLSPHEVFRRVVEVANSTCSLVVITGGEPVRQNLGPLIGLLKTWCSQTIIQIETAGTLWQDCLDDERVSIVVSPKTPLIHPEIKKRAVAFKYVISGKTDRNDGLPLDSTQQPNSYARLSRPRAGAAVYLSPCDEGDEEANAYNRAEVGRLAMKYGYIAGVQLHKILGVP